MSPSTVQMWSGYEIRALREARRMSIRSFAAHLGVSERMISKWEAGGEKMHPRPVNQAALDVSLAGASPEERARFEADVFKQVRDGLHIPGRMLGMPRQPRDMADTDEVQRLDTVTTLVIPGGNEVYGRDEFKSGEDVDIMLMLQETDRTDIGHGTIESLYTIFEKLCRDYPSAPALELQQKLKRLYSQIVRLKQGRMTFAQHKELIALSAWATALLACVDWDLNEREAAEAARAATFRFAQEIGHSELIAWSYEMQAWFALTEGRYGDVTSIAEAAQAIGGENSAIVQLIMQEARGWSRLGNRKAAELAIDRGYSLLQKLPTIDYPRHFIYDRSKFPFYVASCYQWLGDEAKAEQHAIEVIRECEGNGTIPRNPMRLAEVHITLGLIRVQRDDLDGAVEAGSHALTYERRSGPSLLIRATELNGVIAQRFRDTQQANDFDEKVRAICKEFAFQLPTSR